MAMKTRIVCVRKHVNVTVLLLIVLLASTWNFKLVSSSSGGVMGGSFFDSDSSESFTTDDSESERVREQNHIHDAPFHEGAGGGSGPMLFFMVLVFGFFVIGFCNKGKKENNTISVLKLQVGMLGEIGCTIQRDLTRIAEAANTSSREGVCNLLKETIQTLDQHHGYCVAGYSSVDLERSKEDGQKCYNQLSNEERSKFDEETLVNLNNNNKTSIRKQSNDRFSNEYNRSSEETDKFEKEKLLSGFDSKYIVIILLVAAKGEHKLPNMNGTEDLKEALQKLKSLLSSKYLLAGEVLWTPQKEDDTLSDEKLLKDYPMLAKSMKISLVKKHE